VLELAPSPSPRSDIDGVPRSLDAGFSAFVFKVQANMDPAHRDRLAFARICSGRFERGMTVTCDRSNRELTTKFATTAFGPDRATVEEAFPGDVVGLVNATGLQLGDTLYDDSAVTFPPIPRFSPEVFATARPLDTGRAKQFRRGLEQLDEEGVVQVLRDPDAGDIAPILAAVGALQFEVFEHRLASEFNAPAELLIAGYQAIRRTDPASAPRLREIGGIRILTRSDGALVALFENRYRLARLEVDEPELTLEPLVAGAIPVA
jgi:peptide chain release factor 3